MPEVHYKKQPTEVVAVRPILTGLMLLLCVWTLSQSQESGTPWLWHHAFANTGFAVLWPDHKYLQIAEMMFWATFSHFNFWQCLGDVYFIWVFGSAIEQRLGQQHYAILVLLCIFGGWMVLGFETMNATTVHYLGTGLLICGLVGAYVNFFPEKKINPVGTIGRGYKIFRNEKDPDPAAKFGVSPWLIISLFVIYEIGMHFWFKHLNLPVNFDNLSIVSGIAAMVLGGATCYLVVVLSTANMKGDPLRRLALQRYQQLKALDLSHEQSLEGTSRLLNVPIDQVKEWVGKGALPHQLNH